MKKICYLLIVLLLILPAIGVAEKIDYASMSMEELLDNRHAIQTELTKRQSKESEKIYLADTTDGFSMYLTGEVRLMDDFLYIEYIAINNSRSAKRFDAQIYIDNWVYGWKSLCPDLDTGRKNKGTFSVIVDTADDIANGVAIELELFGDYIFHKETSRLGTVILFYRDGSISLVSKK